MNEQAIDVLLNNLENLEKDNQFANKINNVVVQSELEKA